MQRPRDINNNAEFILRVLINRGIPAKNKAKTSHKMTGGVGKVVIKKSTYREKVRSISLLKKKVATRGHEEKKHCRLKFQRNTEFNVGTKNQS